MKEILTGVAGFLLLSSIGSAAQIPSAKDLEVLDQVREAAFRHYIPTDKGRYTEKLICLQADKELSDQFLERLSFKGTVVVRSSECDVDGFRGVRLKRNPQARGVLTTIEDVRWISSREAEVKGGNYWSGIGATYNTLRIAYKKGKWVVKSEISTGVSYCGCRSWKIYSSGEESSCFRFDLRMKNNPTATKNANSSVSHKIPTTLAIAVL